MVREYIASRQRGVTIEVAADKPTTWEAEHGGIALPFECARDEQASGGQYLWAPEEPGQKLGWNSGGATYRLKTAAAGSYKMEGRVLTPTPEDDSFYVGLTTGEGQVLLPDSCWPTGVHTSWQWVEVTSDETRKSIVLELPRGESLLIVRPREAGSKIDAIRLTPR